MGWEDMDWIQLAPPMMQVAGCCAPGDELSGSHEMQGILYSLPNYLHIYISLWRNEGRH
jgi:hypothetical protein